MEQNPGDEMKDDWDMLGFFAEIVWDWLKAVGILTALLFILAFLFWR